MARREENEWAGQYRAAFPKLDRKNHPSMVAGGDYCRLLGVDGRYTGSFRRFPGFKEVLDIRDVDVAVTDDVSDLGTDLAVWFFKYLVVQAVVGEDTYGEEGTTNYPAMFAGGVERTLRGFVGAHNYKSGANTRGVLRFIWWDTTANAGAGGWASQPLILEVDKVARLCDGRYEVSTSDAGYGDGVISASAEYDVASMGPFIYTAVKRGGDFTSNDGIVPYEIDGANDASFEGGTPRNYYNRSIRVISTGASTLRWQYTEFGPLMFTVGIRSSGNASGWPSANQFDFSDETASTDYLRGAVRFTARMFSGAKNAEGPLMKPKDPSHTVPTDGSYKFAWGEGNQGGTGDIDKPYTRQLPNLFRLGIDDDQLAPAIKVFRSLSSYWFDDIEVEAPSEDVLGGFLMEVDSERVVPMFTWKGTTYGEWPGTPAENDAVSASAGYDMSPMRGRSATWTAAGKVVTVDTPIDWLSTQAVSCELVLDETTGSTYTACSCAGVFEISEWSEGSNTITVKQAPTGPDAGGSSGVRWMVRPFTNTGHYGDSDINEAEADPGIDTGVRIQMGHRTDFELAAKGARLEPLTQDTAWAPKHLKLFLPYQGTLLRIGSMPRPNPPTILFDREEVLSWGSLIKYAPEECRVGDAVPLGDSQDETVLALVAAGDYAFAVGASSVYAIRRDTKWLTVNKAQTMSGGVGRYAAVGVGTSLFVVSPSGMFVYDGATEQAQLVSAMDRIILEDWRESLGAVRMTYDMRLGALMLLNDTEDEMVIMWNNTGAITTLRNCPWIYATYGENPEDAGTVRSYWITGSGVIHTPNADREDGYSQTMCGEDADLSISGSRIWNGTAGATSTQLNVKVAEFIGGEDEVDAAAVAGFHLLMTSGDNKGYSVEISTVTDDGVTQTITLTEELPYEVATGDQFAIAPIEFEVVGWPLQQGDRGADLFGRKVVDSMSHDVILKAGETGTANPNIFMDHLMYHRGSITVNTHQISRIAGLNVSPSNNFSWLSVSGPVLIPAWRQMSSNLDFEWLGGIVHGTITSSEADTDPAT
jgi:hypothetical protein